MEIIIMSRSEIEEYAVPEGLKVDVISIYDSHNFPTDFLYEPDRRIHNVIQLEFEDVERGHADSMEKLQAMDIAQFVQSLDKDTDKLIVHCEMGMSRSTGVAAAIMKFLGQDNWKVFNDRSYCPNMWCYRLVLEAFKAPIDEQELSDKWSKNASFWT